MHHLEVGAAVEDLDFAPEAAGPHPAPGGNIPQGGVPLGNEGIPAILPEGHRAQGAPRGHLRRHVFEAVDGQVDFPGQQGLLYFLDEQALARPPGPGARL